MGRVMDLAGGGPAEPERSAACGANASAGTGPRGAADDEAGHPAAGGPLSRRPDDGVTDALGAVDEAITPGHGAEVAVLDGSKREVAGVHIEILLSSGCGRLCSLDDAEPSMVRTVGDTGARRCGDLRERDYFFFGA